MSQSIKLSITSNGTKYKFHISDVIPDNNVVYLSVKFPTSSSENKIIEADETKLNNFDVDDNDTRHDNNNQQHDTDGQLTFLRGNANTQSIHVTELKNNNVPRLHQQNNIRLDAAAQTDDRHTNQTIDQMANRNTGRNRLRRRRTTNHPVNQTANQTIDQTANRNTGRNGRRRRRPANQMANHTMDQTINRNANRNRNASEINEQPVIYINANDIAHDGITHRDNHADAPQSENQTVRAEDLFLQSFSQGLTSIINSLIGSNSRRTQQLPTEPPVFYSPNPFGSRNIPNLSNPFNSLDLLNTMPNNRTLPNNTNNTATYHEMLRNLDEQYNRERRDLLSTQPQDQQQTQQQQAQQQQAQQQYESQDNNIMNNILRQNRQEQNRQLRQSNREQQDQYNNIHSGDLDILFVPIIDSNLLNPLHTRLASTMPNNTTNTGNTLTPPNTDNIPSTSTTVHSSGALATIHTNIIRNAGDKNRPKIPIEIVASMPQYRALEEKNNVLFGYFKSTMTAVDELLLLAMNSTNAGIAHTGKILDVEFGKYLLKMFVKMTDEQFRLFIDLTERVIDGETSDQMDNRQRLTIIARLFRERKLNDVLTLIDTVGCNCSYCGLLQSQIQR